MYPWIFRPAASFRISIRSGRSPNSWKKRSPQPRRRRALEQLAPVSTPLEEPPLVSEKPTVG